MVALLDLHQQKVMYVYVCMYHAVTISTCILPLLYVSPKRDQGIYKLVVDTAF